MTQPKALSNTQIARAALVVLAGFLASGVLGVVRTAIITAQFGTDAALDAFFAAQRLPEVVFVLVAGGALGSSFIPIYAQQRDQDEARAWRLASAVMTLTALAAALLGAGVALAAPWLVEHVLLSASPPEAQALTANMMRLMMVTPFIFSISGLLMGILQSHGLFLLPALAISMNNIGLIIGALVIAPALPPLDGLGQVGANNIYGLALGAVLSALLHLAVQLPGLRQVSARLRPLPDPRVPGVTRVLALMGPRVLGLAVVQVNFIVNIILADPMATGSLSALTVAFTLMFFALGVIGQSVGSAVFPSLAALAAAGDMDGYKDRLARATRSVLFLALPATIALIVLAEPLVRVLFERGQWTAEDTQATAWALAFYATGIAGFALLEVFSRAFYALADTWTVVRVGIAAMIANIALSLIFIQVIGVPGSLARGPFAGLALANALTTLLEALALWWLLRARVGDVNDAYVLAGASRALLAALGMGAALLGVLALLHDSGALAQLIAAGVIGGAVFFGLSLALGLPEARVVPMMALRRLKR
jgi:putative peptidoglycan lipid II flippase